MPTNTRGDVPAHAPSTPCLFVGSVKSNRLPGSLSVFLLSLSLAEPMGRAFSGNVSFFRCGPGVVVHTARGGVVSNTIAGALVK